MTRESMRLDSIKSWLSQRSTGDLDAYPLRSDMNWTSVKLTEGDWFYLSCVPYDKLSY